MNDPTAAGAVTLINVIELPADEVDRFVDGWRRRADFMRRQPGFQGYRLHRAVSTETRIQLVNVARWDSREAFRTAMSDPEFQARMRAVTDGELHVTAEPGLYQVVLEARSDPAPRKAAT